MKKIWALLVLLVCLTAPAWAVTYTTTVSSTGVVDSDGFTWKYGTYKVDFVFPPNVSSFSSVSWGGGAFQQEYKGNLSSTGTFTQILPSNAYISPAGSMWRFTFCPNATSGCFTYTASISGSTLNATTAINAVAKGPRFTQSQYNYGYGPVEVGPAITVGAFFYDTTVGACKQYTGTSWGLCPSNASTYDSTNVAITGGSVDGTTVGATTPSTVGFTALTAGGTKFGVTGCGTATSLVGGSLAGKFVAASATCTPVVTTHLTAPNGYSCWMNDHTTSTVKFQETAYTQTTVTFTATGTLGGTDTIDFGCIEF
jgi:hypothetical protein